MDIKSFNGLISHFLKEQEEELKKAILKEKNIELSGNISSNYKLDSNILKNWNEFLDRETNNDYKKENKQDLSERRAKSLLEDKDKYSTDDLHMFVINELDMHKRNRKIKSYIEEGYNQNQAEELVRFDDFLLINKKYFKDSANLIKVNNSKKNLDINKIINREKILLFKKEYGNITEEELNELKSIELIKDKKSNKLKSEKDFLSHDEVIKIKEKEERITLRKQYYQAQGYSEEKIKELIEQEF